MCGVRRCVRVRRASKSSGWLSRGFVFGWLVAPSPDARSRSAVRYILDLPQSSPSLSAGRSTASPTPEYSTTVFQVHRGGSNPSRLSSRPVVGDTPSISPRSVSSVCLPDRPSLAGTPRSGASDGSSPVCLRRESHREQQSFSYGVDSFIGNDRFTPPPLTRSSDNSLHPSRYSRPRLFCLLSAGVAHLTLVVWGGRHTSTYASSFGFKAPEESLSLASIAFKGLT